MREDKQGPIAGIVFIALMFILALIINSTIT